jgi:hypothetical protein
MSSTAAIRNRWPFSKIEPLDNTDDRRCEGRPTTLTTVAVVQYHEGRWVIVVAIRIDGQGL